MTRIRSLNQHFRSKIDLQKHFKNDRLFIACQSLHQSNVPIISSLLSLVSVIYFDSDRLYNIKSKRVTSRIDSDDRYNINSKRMKSFIDCSSNQTINQSINQGASNHVDVNDGNEDEINDHSLTSIIKTLARAISNSKLKTLQFSETSRDLAIISKLIKEVESIKQSITLSELVIELKGPQFHSSTADYEIIPSVNISTLFRSQTLQTVKLTCYDVPEQLLTLSSLPPSVTHLELLHDWKFEDHVFPSLLSNPEWLPNVRHLDLNGDITSHPSLLTIMHATGLPRPYSYIEMMLVDETLAHGQFDMLEHLGIVLDCEVWSSFQQFATIENTAFPRLKSFSLNEEFGPRPDVGCDLNPLIMFLSQRPIEKIVLRLCVENVSAWAPFTDESVLGLAKLRSLTQFRLDYLSKHRKWPEGFQMFESDDIRSLIKPNSWPNLRELAVVSAMPITALDAFFQAAPQLQSVVWRHQNKEGLCLLAVVSMIDKLCPTVEKITLFADHSAPTYRHDILYSASINLNLPHLKTLYIHDDSVTNPSLQLLISKVSHAKIEDFMIQSPTPDSVRWSLPEIALHVVMQRKFRHLKCMWFPKDQQLISKLEGMNRRLPDGRTWPFSALEFMPEELLVRGELCPGHDETGQTSLDAICNFILRFVRPIDQRNLQFFDQNNYDVAGWPNFNSKMEG